MTCRGPRACRQQATGQVDIGYIDELSAALLEMGVLLTAAPRRGLPVGTVRSPTKAPTAGQLAI
eukprot:scaffold425960_cov39-Prasinocladus_malaysianus.AAC.1